MSRKLVKLECENQWEYLKHYYMDGNERVNINPEKIKKAIIKGKMYKVISEEYEASYSDMGVPGIARGIRLYIMVDNELEKDELLCISDKVMDNSFPDVYIWVDSE